MVNRVKRRISCLPKATYYKLGEVSLCDLEIINVSMEELETIRLCCLLHLEQNKGSGFNGYFQKDFLE